jgi:histidinol-phosphate aminotransferase
MSHEYEKVLTPTSGLRLHLNENTAGCSPKVIEALANLTRQDIAFYPGYDEAVSVCAKRLGVETDDLVLTNGLDEGILALTIAALRTRDASVPEAIIVSPTFDMYAATADAVGAKVVDVPVDDDFSFPTARILTAITPNTRLLFLTSPNNPTGLSIAADDVLRIASAAPHVRVLVDEAYIDFGGATLVGHPGAKVLPNLFVGRTFAKAYGLAGLRAGAVIGNRGAIALLRHIVPPFSLNVAATVALIAGLSDIEYYEWYRGQVQTSKQRLYEALSRVSVPFWKSDANFVLARFGDRAPAVVSALAARGVYVRDKSRDPACPGCIRITAGVVAHTEACIRALEEVVCGEA